MTSILLEHLLLRSDPMLRLFRQALPLLYLQTDVSFVMRTWWGLRKLDELLLLIYRVSEASLDTSSDNK
jgi:hypothetical protein